MKTHDLKTDPEVFAAVITGAKTHEIRLNDRGFAVGDLLVLRETVYTGAEMKAGGELLFTGRTALREVSHIQTGYGLMAGWCILSFVQYADDARQRPAAQLAIGVAAPQGATISIMQPHADGTTTVIYGETHPAGDSMGRAIVAVAPGAIVAEVNVLDGNTYTKFLTKLPDGKHTLYTTTPTIMGIDWSTDYLTEQRAAMREDAARIAESSVDRYSAAARIRALQAGPTLTQGSIDRTKDALEDFAGAVWDKPNTASQVDPCMAMPSKPTP